LAWLSGYRRFSRDDLRSNGAFDASWTRSKPMSATFRQFLSCLVSNNENKKSQNMLLALLTCEVIGCIVFNMIILFSPRSRARRTNRHRSGHRLLSA